MSGGTLPFQTPVQPTGVDPDGINTDISIAISYQQTGYFAEIFIDANGCQALWEDFIEEPDPITLAEDPSYYVSNYGDDDNVLNVSCFGASDGQIGVDNPITINGGTGTYTYSWDGTDAYDLLWDELLFKLLDISHSISMLLKSLLNHLFDFSL